jgi:pantoate--beta-alanine ligase
MILFKKIETLSQWIDNQRQGGKKIGFAPTMGALHPGHVSLIEAAKRGNDITISSIFVNPTQFNDPKDFDKYPVTIEKDITLLEAAGCNVLFLPSVDEMYPDGVKQHRIYDLGFLETVFDGAYRPGHFQGVCTVVHRLLEIVLPDNLYMGQKDYQQCMVIARLIELISMKQDIQLHVCPTLREPDGLAMSSRNMRLTKEERSIAPAIHKSLSHIKDNLEKGETTLLVEAAKKILIENNFRIDYLELADARNLSPVANWDGKQKLVVLVAAFLNEIRLIDNMVLPE